MHVVLPEVMVRHAGESGLRRRYTHNFLKKHALRAARMRVSRKKVVIIELAPSTTRRPDGKPGRKAKMGVGDSVAVARQIQTVFEAAQPAL